MSYSERSRSTKNPLTWGYVAGQSAIFAIGELAVNRMANSFGSGLDKLKDSLSLKEFLPNMDVLLTMSNFKTALLAIHLGASLIDFPDQSTHPNKNDFVRAVATADNFLHHQPDHLFPTSNYLHKTIQYIVNFTAPVAIHTAPNLIYGGMDIINNHEENPLISNALISLGVMGGLHILGDLLKITAKYLEYSSNPVKHIESGEIIEKTSMSSFTQPADIRKSQPRLKVTLGTRAKNLPHSSDPPLIDNEQDRYMPRPRPGVINRRSRK